MGKSRRLQANAVALFSVLAGCSTPVDGHFETHTLDASSYAQTYTLSVFLPDEPATTVVYLFDGDDWTQDTAGIVSALARDGTPAPMVVGVGYGDSGNKRHRDYTPSAPGIPDGHGEVAAFYGFMTDDLVPWVDAEWDTDPSAEGRVAMGHSFGGIAALWALLHHSDVFGNAVALSPSLVFGDAVFFDMEAEYAATHTDLAANAYLGAGSQEAYGLAGLTQAFGDELASRDYPSLDLRTELHKGRFHASLFPAGAEAGLAFVLDTP